jgi:DNA-binding CsgD family transcriptional regulator
VRATARIVGADVWIWVTGVSNPDIRGDAMITSFVDGGFRSEEERAAFLRVIIHPVLAAIVGAPIQDALRLQSSITCRRRQLVSQREWLKSSVSSVWSDLGFDDFILSVYPTGKGGHSGLGYHRRKGRPPFSERDRQVAEVVTQQIPWLHQAGRNDAAAPIANRLTPRERQVLLCLIDGDSRKRISTKLQLSEHTIIDYLKAIYRKFKVKSRAELLSLFISPETAR